MVLVDRRILAGGLAMLAVGMALTVAVSSDVPAGRPGMTEDEALELRLAEQENRDYTTLSGMLIGVGFLLVLISFGARRKKGGAKKAETKPAQ